MDKELISFQDESEDVILARIQEESLRYYNEVELPRRAAEEKTSTERQEDTPQLECSKVPDSCHITPVKDVFYRRRGDGAEGFHLSAGETYVYPTNYPIRKYQKNIIQSSLFHNTLVSLPTGLGKTFIAAVVMYNYYRWFPEGKVVFMAPTRPLVAQQIRACHDIMAIPIGDTVEMTGTMNPTNRTQQWISKRVFFLTPQVMANDLRSGICPAKHFKCVVIDEAHKATKEYAYCHVIKELENAGAIFRVLALSATPGSNIKAVVEVVQNLRISKLEFRGEDSPDVTPYTHTKQVEAITLSLSKDITDFREKFLMIFEKYLKNLRDSRFVTCNVQNLTKFQLLKSSEKMRSRPPCGMTKERMGVLMSDFTVCMTLAHGLELLQTYGLRAFYHYFTACEDEENRKAAFTRLRQDVGFLQLMDSLQKFVSSPMEQFWSHPKHENLVKILKKHFLESVNDKTKVIIFCQYRVVVNELYELLHKIDPCIRPVMFIGQGIGKDKSGIPQKKQMEIMKQFREGHSNVLIATCVAEEGLDIGSVDLLILMEVQRSPVRLVQRLGRTGRHRKGHCVVLLTQGKEVQKFDEAMATSKTFLKNIQNSKVLIANLYRDDPTMIPPDIAPKMQLVHINVPVRVTPGKVKKQSYIQQTLLSKLNDTVPELESPFISKEQLEDINEELGSYQNTKSLSFTSSKYLYPRMNDSAMDVEELLMPDFCMQSEYNDWNRLLHQTYLLSHSSDSKMLCHLLNNAESMHLGQYPDIRTQICVNNEVMNQEKCTINKIKNNKEMVKKENIKKHLIDIRKCLTVVADKSYLTQDQHCNESVTPIDSPGQENGHVQQHYNIVSDEENMNINKLSTEKECLLCNQTNKGSHLKPNHNSEYTYNKELTLTLNNVSRLENLLKNLTKDIIVNINVSKLFPSDKSHITNRNNIYFVSNTPKKMKNAADSIDAPQIDEDNLDQYFNLDDLFNDEDEVCALNKNIKQDSKLFSPKENSESSKTISLNMLNKSKTKIKILDSTFCNGNEKNTNKTISNDSFKTPKLKLNFQIPGSNGMSNVALTNVSESGIDSTSPVLSGQMSSSIPSKIRGNSPSQGCCKSLFTDNYSTKVHDCNLSSITKESFYPPVKSCKNKTESEEVQPISVDQLFIDDDDGSKDDQRNILEQSSMYTITQMVDKVTASKEKYKLENDLSVVQNLNVNSMNNVFFDNSDDTLFQNINIDHSACKRNIENCKESSVADVNNVDKNTWFLKAFDTSKLVQRDNLDKGGNHIAEGEIISGTKPSSPTTANNIKSRLLNCTGSPLNKSRLQTSTPHSFIDELSSVASDSDTNSDVFQSPQHVNKLKHTMNYEKNSKKNRKNKRNMFLESEADVSGPPISSDEENTSGLDDLEESFINDLTEHPNSSVCPTLDVQAQYLQSIKSPERQPGGFKIPAISSSVLAMDVYSQLDEEEDDEDNTYVNDSFCCDLTEIPTVEEPSLLEIAEKILNSKKYEKTKKRRRIHISPDSSPDNESAHLKKKSFPRFKSDYKQHADRKSTFYTSSDNRSLIKNKALLESESDSEEPTSINKNKTKKRCLSSSDSSPDVKGVIVKSKNSKRHRLLTSSDSDITI